MSLILEALKKSELQRRLGNAPHLGTPILVTRRRGPWLPILAGLLVIAIAAGSWWLLQAHRAGADRIATADTAAAAPTGSARTATAAPPARGHVQERRPRRAGTGANATPTTKSPGSPGGAIAPKAALPGARTPNAGAGNAAAAVAASAPKSALPPQGKKSPAPVPGKTVAPRSNAAVSAARPAAPATAVAPKAAAPATPRVPPAAPSKAKRNALPLVWELPYATRKDLPELSLIMHVYSANPAERFVVLNGERHVEGDAVGDDLDIEEIRPDGVVLDYKGQRFLLPRDGR